MDPVSGLPSGPYASLRQRVLDGGVQQSEAGGDVAVSEAARAAQAGTAPAASAPVLDPSRINDRIHALIDNQVAAGRITGDQAGILRQVLSAPEAGAADAAEGAQAPAPSGASTDTDGGAGGAATARGARQSPSDTLASFIQHVQRSQGRTVGYGSDGARNSDLTSSRLLDFNT